MRHVGLVLGPGFQVMGLAALTAFEFANHELHKAAYTVSVMSVGGGMVRSSLGMALETAPLSLVPDTLLVVGEVRPSATPEALRRFLAEAGHTTRRVAGVCTGAFALAEAGLLNDRTATTHWAYARLLQERFPRIKVEADRIFTVDGNIWTSAGMSAAIDLSLALIEDDHGAELSRTIARNLVVYHRRPGGQSQFSALLEMEPRSDRIRRALIHAKENLRNSLSVEELAEAASLSPRQFSRVFREETGQSPAKAVERLRLEAAKVMMEEGRHPIETVARETGFADRDRMRRAFLRFFGQPPQSLRRSLRLIEGEEASQADLQ